MAAGGGVGGGGGNPLWMIGRAPDSPNPVTIFLKIFVSGQTFAIIFSFSLASSNLQGTVMPSRFSIIYPQSPLFLLIS